MQSKQQIFSVAMVVMAVIKMWSGRDGRANRDGGNNDDNEVGTLIIYNYWTRSSKIS